MLDEKASECFKCLQCGICCHEYEFAKDQQVKMIPVFPDELIPLEDFAEKNDIKVKFIEGVIFPDEINEKILVIAYRIVLDGDERVCPFFSPHQGCQVNDFKPLSCKAYPLAVKLIDAYSFQIEIDPYCSYIGQEEQEIRTWEGEKVKSFFSEEYKWASALMRKNQATILSIRKLTAEGKIRIPDEISQEKYNNCLNEWDREYLSDFST